MKIEIEIKPCSDRLSVNNLIVEIIERKESDEQNLIKSVKIIN